MSERVVITHFPQNPHGLKRTTIMHPEGWCSFRLSTELDEVSPWVTQGPNGERFVHQEDEHAKYCDRRLESCDDPVIVNDLRTAVVLNVKTNPRIIPV